MKRIGFLFCTIFVLMTAVGPFTCATISSADLMAAAQNPSPAPAPQPASRPVADVRVIDVYKYGCENEKDERKRNSAGIGDMIVVKVKDLQALTNQAMCLDDSGKQVPGCREQAIVLYLDRRKMSGIVAESSAPRTGDGTLLFHLQRNADNDEILADLLGAPALDGKFFKRPIQVSVGLENGYAIPTNIKNEEFKIIRIRSGLFWVCSIGFVLFSYLLLVFATKCDMLRDSGPQPTGTDKHGRNKQKPYSLGRCQMAFWFFWIIASFLFIWLITGANDIITASALGLIGIGAGTALGAVTIEVGKREDTKSQLSNLEAEKLVLDREIAELDAQINATPPPAKLGELQQTRTAKRARLNFVNAQIATLSVAARPHESEGFLKDVLSDVSGSISFHRFQMFVWTVVLGSIFIYSVWYRLSMPEFSAALLALQGISAGTYIGFKIPEKQS